MLVVRAAAAQPSHPDPKHCSAHHEHTEERDTQGAGTVGLDAASAKMGLGVPEILEAIVQRIPPPEVRAAPTSRAPPSRRRRASLSHPTAAPRRRLTPRAAAAAGRGLLLVPVPARNALK